MNEREQSGLFTEICEALWKISDTSHMLRSNIAPDSLKISCTNLYSIKCDKTSMNLFALSLWKNFSRGLTYFDQVISRIL